MLVIEQTSYTVTFASFLLFWGRVSDLYSARSVVVYGFLVFALFSLVNSFVTERISFFVIRAITGIFASALVQYLPRIALSPWSVFPPEERSRAYTLYGMTGSIANVTGTLIAGDIELIPDQGQMRSWRWFFRIVAAIS